MAVTQGNTLVQNARMLALLNLTMADEAIAGWDAKYTYNFWRPVTAIRAADTDGNPDTVPDPNWMPLFATPSHPSYPAAHAFVSSGAAAELTSFFGTDAIPFSISWEGLPGVTRTFAGFTAAGDEASMSRLWAGIHWSFDITAGHALGLSVAGYVFQNFLLPRTSPPPRTAPAPTNLGLKGFTAVEEFSAIPGGSLGQVHLGSSTPSGAALAPGGSGRGTDPTAPDMPLRSFTVYLAAEDEAGTSVLADTRAMQRSGAQVEKAHPSTHYSDGDDEFSSANSWEDRVDWTR